MAISIPYRGRRGLAVAYFAYFAFLGVLTPFFPLWLSGQQLAAPSIALAGGLMTLAATAGQALLPAAGLWLGLRSTTLLVASAALLLTMLLLVAHAPGPILILATVSGLFSGAMIPLVDSHALADGGSDYGGIRALGSVGFALANLGGGWAIDHFGTRIVVPLELALLALMLFGLFFTKSVPRPVTAPPARRVLAETLLHARLWLLILTVATINASHAYYYTFANLHWADTVGRGASAMGVLWAIGVASEIAVLALFGRLRGLRPALWLILAAGAAGVVRWGLAALDPPFGLLALLQILHGFTFGAAILGGVLALREMVDARIAPAALGLFSAMVHGVVIGGVMLLLGGRFGPQGPDGFLLMAGIAGVGLVLALLLIAGLGNHGAATGRDRLCT